MTVNDKRTVTIIIEQRLELDGVDSMYKAIIQKTVPMTVDIDHVLDKIREILVEAKENPFTFL